MCLLCESKSLQAFTSPGHVISRQAESNRRFCAFLPAFCCYFPSSVGTAYSLLHNLVSVATGSHQLWLVVELIPYTSAQSPDLSCRGEDPALQQLSFVGHCLTNVVGEKVNMRAPECNPAHLCFSHCCILRFGSVFKGCVLLLVMTWTRCFHDESWLFVTVWK